MRTARWKPLPTDIMGAARELATQLRHLVDREGLTLRRLAADDQIPYDVATLRRFFSGQELPPGRLVEVIAERCGGDREQLLSTLARAVTAREAGFPWAAGSAGTAARTAGTAGTAPRRSLRGRPGWVIAAVAGLVVATNAVTAAVVAGLSDGSSPQRAAAATESASPSRRPARRSAAAEETTPTSAATRRPTRGYQAATREPSGNLIRNGTFTGTVKSWWPVSDVRISQDADRLRADVRGGSTESWGRIVSATSFPLAAGRRYILSFDAAADADIADRVTVQLDYQPYTAALGRGIELSTLMRRFSYEFTGNVTTEQAAVNFELGGHPGDHTIWLDNVTLDPA